MFLTISNQPRLQKPLQVLKTQDFRQLRRPRRFQTPVRYMLSQFYPIPTASRVQSYYYESQKKKELEQTSFLKNFLHAIENALEHFSDPSIPYDVSFIVPPKALKVPKLPYPEFHIPKPSRHLFSSQQNSTLDEHSPSHLLKESLPLEPIEPLFEKEIIEALTNISQGKASLKIDPKGTLYLHVSTGATLFKELPAQNFVVDKNRLPLSTHPLAIHIPVMSPKESQKAQTLGLQNELDKEFSFQIKKCFYLETPANEGYDGALLAEIESKDLEELRAKYLLPEKLSGHLFHIIILLQNKLETSKKPKELFRLNVSCFAA